jgi:hypothetical protein
VVLVEPGDYRTGFTASRRTTEESARNMAYRASLERAVRRMATDEQAASPPDSVARLIHQVIQRRKPRLRYTCGPVTQRAAVWLKRLAPNSLVEALVRGYYLKEG